MPYDSEHSALLDAAQRELAIARLCFLRDPAEPLLRLPNHARLVSPEGQERLEQALRQGEYPSAELSQLPRALADLARGALLHEGRRALAGWLRAEIHVGGSGYLPVQLLAMLAYPGSSPLGLHQVLRALGDALDPHVGYWLDLADRADAAADAQLTAAERAMPRSRTAEPKELAQAPQPPEAELAAAPPKPLNLAELAESWLTETDDAARELSAWLVKQSPVTAGDELARLWLGLRAPALDGLSRAQRRFHRLAEGARRMGFEREMTARMHGETASSVLVPVPGCISAGSPYGVRVLQPGLEYGWLSDLAVAQGIGEGLALALASPSLGPAAGPLRSHSVSRGIGGLFLQLRAERDYLQRVDGLEPKPATQLSRQTALWLLLRVRVAAAVCAAVNLPSRSQAERRERLMRAGERALGRDLPGSVLALGLVQDTTPAQTFAALMRGFELHAALRERYDSDFYLNPRVSEVVRGAAARGSLLSAAELASELRAAPRAGIKRLLELLG